GLLRDAAGRGNLPSHPARRHRCRLRLSLDVGRPRAPGGAGSALANTRERGDMTLPPAAELARLQRLLGGPALEPLRKRLRDRFARGRTSGVVTLSSLTPEERGALAGLLGRRPADARSLRVELSELDQALSRAGLASSLRDALELLDGPIV